jgi:hypothetical protein
MSPPDKTYRLHVKVNGRWVRQCEIEAESHAVAFGRAMVCLKPEHYELPIRLEQVEAARPERRRGKP